MRDLFLDSIGVLLSALNNFNDKLIAASQHIVGQLRMGHFVALSLTVISLCARCSSALLDVRAGCQTMIDILNPTEEAPSIQAPYLVPVSGAEIEVEDLGEPVESTANILKKRKKSMMGAHSTTAKRRKSSTKQLSTLASSTKKTEVVSPNFTKKEEEVEEKKKKKKKKKKKRTAIAEQGTRQPSTPPAGLPSPKQRASLSQMSSIESIFGALGGNDGVKVKRSMKERKKKKKKKTKKPRLG